MGTPRLTRASLSGHAPLRGHVSVCAWRGGRHHPAPAAAQQSDLVLMGGYDLQPVLEVVIGSTVDQILRASRLPTLVCQ